MARLRFILAVGLLTFLAMMTHRTKIWLARPKVAPALDGSIGASLMSFGVKLALTQR